MLKKSAILSVVLFIPVLIYIFLNSFGDNTFEIPNYFQNGVTSEYCGLDTKEAYQLSDRQATIYYAHTTKNNYIEKVLKESVRIIDKSKIRILGLYDLNEVKMTQIEGIEYKGLLPNEYVDFLSCGLLVYTQGTNVFDYIVLVDQSGVIRGYYLASDDEEYDRLYAELKILSEFYD